MTIRTGASLLAMSILLATPAFAQTAGTNSAANDLEQSGEQRAASIAGEAPASDDSEVIVTGTRIVRPNTRSAAPIVTTTSAEIQAQGAATIEEVLNRLPQVQANLEQNFSESEGRQRIKLRSLGYERTLMLIDGLRFGLPNTIDVGIIPTALVERIDVLSGGASSVYGSDAISGVVNYIMKKNFEGIRLDANYSFFNHDNRENDVTDAARRARFSPRTGMVNDGGRTNVTLSAGTNLFDGRVNVTSFINYRQSDSINLSDRSTSACEATFASRTAPLSCLLASFTAAGTIIPQSGPNAGRLLVNNPNGDRTFVGINTVPGTSNNPYDEHAVQRNFERVNVGGFLTADISDDIELYSSVLFYRDKSFNTFLNRTFNFSAYGEGPYRVNCDNPFLSASQSRDLCGANAGVAGQFAPIDLRYRFDSQPPQMEEWGNESYRIVGGLRGRGFGGAWSYDIATMFTRAQIEARGTQIVDYDRLNRALDVVSVNGTPTCRSALPGGVDPTCVPLNAFIPANGDRAAVAYLYGQDDGATSIRIPRLFQVVGTVSGDLGNYGITSPLAEQGVAIALGVEYRDELERRTANEAFRRLTPGEDLRLTQNILEANVEVNIPIVENRPWTERLELTGGYRLSKYDVLEGKFDTWKIEGIWSPISDITFRGSYNKAQRATDVTGVAAARDIFFSQGFYSDPCATRPNPANPSQDPNGAQPLRLPPIATLEQCRNTGLPDNLYASPTLVCPDERCTTRDGGFNLTPETAYTKTFGVVLQPRFIPGLTLSVDRFLIDLEDQLTFLQPQNIINECLLTGDPFFCRGIIRNPGSGTLSSSPAGTPATGYVVRGPANGFRSSSHGWDFQGQYNLSLGRVGRLDFGFNGTLMTEVGGQDSPTIANRNCVGYFGNLCGESMPKWAHQLRTTWTSSDRTTSVSLNWRHRGGMPLDIYSPEDTGIPRSTPNDNYRGIGAFNWFDLALTFNVTEKMSFSLAANNILDTDPPFVPGSRSRIGLLRGNTIMGYDLLGRQIVAGISVRM